MEWYCDGVPSHYSIVLDRHFGIVSAVTWLFFPFRGVQFSMTLRLTQSDCNNGTTESLNVVDFKAVRDVMAKGEIYNKGPITAAIPLRKFKKDGTPYTEHSERRVLSSTAADRVQCLIFYTYNSPCTKHCLGTDLDLNISAIVKETFQHVSEGYKAFVFSTIYYKDLDQTKAELFTLMKQIEGPKIYCCYETSNGVKCFGLNMNVGPDQHCLSQIEAK